MFVIFVLKKREPKYFQCITGTLTYSLIRDSLSTMTHNLRDNITHSVVFRLDDEGYHCEMCGHGG